MINSSGQPASNAICYLFNCSLAANVLSLQYVPVYDMIFPAAAGSIFDSSAADSDFAFWF